MVILSLTCVVARPSPARAGYRPAATALSLDEAVDMALSSNAQLEAARSALDIERARVVAAHAYPNPELSIEGAPSVPDAEEYGYGVALDQQVPILGKVAKRVALATEELERESWSVKDLARRIAARVRTSYRRTQVTDLRIRLAQRLATLNERLLTIARTRFDRGEVSELDVQQFAVELAQRRYEAERLDSDRGSEWLELASLLNVPQSERPTLTDQIAGRRSPFPLQPLLEAARNRPDLMALESEAKAAELERQLRTAERWADPTIGIHYRRERSRFDQPIVLTDTADFVGVQVKIPLPLLYRNEGEIAAASARKRNADAHRSSALVEVDREVRDAHQRAISNLAAIAGLERGIEAASKGQRLAERAYADGLINAVQLIQAQQQRYSAESARLDALEAYYQALSDLERAVDAPIDGVLSNADQVQP